MLKIKVYLPNPGVLVSRNGVTLISEVGQTSVTDQTEVH